VIEFEASRDRAEAVLVGDSMGELVSSIDAEDSVAVALRASCPGPALIRSSDVDVRPEVQIGVERSAEMARVSHGATSLVEVAHGGRAGHAAWLQSYRITTLQHGKYEIGGVALSPMS
jgi:hypothetical protein